MSWAECFLAGNVHRAYKSPAPPTDTLQFSVGSPLAREDRILFETSPVGNGTLRARKWLESLKKVFICDWIGPRTAYVFSHPVFPLRVLPARPLPPPASPSADLPPAHCMLWVEKWG